MFWKRPRGRVGWDGLIVHFCCQVTHKGSTNFCLQMCIVLEALKELGAHEEALFVWSVLLGRKPQ